MPDYKVFRGPTVANVGQPIAICVTTTHDETIVTVEWYLLVRTSPDVIGHRRNNRRSVDTEVNRADPFNPIALTQEDAEKEAMQDIKREFRQYCERMSKVPPHEQQIAEVEFEACGSDDLAKMVYYGAAKKDFEFIRSITRSAELKHHLFSLLELTPKREPIKNPYEDDPKSGMS